MRTVLLGILVIALTACTASEDGGSIEQDAELEHIKLPDGFRITYYSDTVPNARSMVYSDRGILFVGTRAGGNVYAVVDADGDFKADTTITIVTDLESPNGVALLDGDLYVAEISRILKFSDIEEHLDNPPAPIVVKDDLPTEGHHGWKYIHFGPDGKLYIPIGAPCNVCDPGTPYASIWRMNPDGSEFELVASGVRNSVGFTWHPVTGDLWFTDNGRDLMGDDIPNDELNRAPDSGLHFGYPYFHEGSIADPEFGAGRIASDYQGPVLKLGPHVAALGIEFYQGSMFPADYRNRLFVAQHGSWNRSKKIGYRVMTVTLNASSEVTDYSVFAEGWLDGEESWGRPVDVEVLPDGSLLISDDQKGAIYRITSSDS